MKRLKQFYVWLFYFHTATLTFQYVNKTKGRLQLSLVRKHRWGKKQGEVADALNVLLLIEDVKIKTLSELPTFMGGVGEADYSRRTTSFDFTGFAMWKTLRLSIIGNGFTLDCGDPDNVYYYSLENKFWYEKRED